MKEQRPLTQRMEIKLNPALLPENTPEFATPTGNRRDSTSVLYGKEEFFVDPLERKVRVLVLGCNNVDNTFVRNVEAFGFEAVHMEGDPGCKFPSDVDAAIVVQGVCSHAAFYDVKEWAKANNKKLFGAMTGWSEIKEDFNHYFFKFAKDLNSLNINLTTKLHFLLALFLREPGTKFSVSDFHFYVKETFDPTIQAGMIQNFFTAAIPRGFLLRETSLRSKGKYKFLGFNKETLELFQRSKAPGVPIPQAWTTSVATEQDFESAPEVTPGMPEAAMVASSPLPQTTTVIVTEEPAKKISNDDKLEMVLQAVSDMQEQLGYLSNQMNPRVLQDNILEALPKLSTRKLHAIWELIQD